MSATFLMASFDKAEGSPTVKFLQMTPAIAAGIGLCSIFLCLIITKATNVDTGGLNMPYISDTGREGGSYFVFSIFNTIAGILLLVTYHLNNLRLWVLQQKVNGGTGHTVARCFGIGFGALGAVGLIVLSIVSSMMDADTHLYAAYLFFVGTIIFACVNTSLIARARAIAPPETRDQLVPKKLWALKSVVTVLIALFFVIYIPVGMAVVCDWNYNEATKLYDYTDCLETHQLRAATQHLCVWSLLVYLMLLVEDFAPHNMVLGHHDKAGGDVVVGHPADPLSPALTSIEVVANSENEANKA